MIRTAARARFVITRPISGRRDGPGVRLGLQRDGVCHPIDHPKAFGGIVRLGRKPKVCVDFRVCYNFEFAKGRDDSALRPTSALWPTLAGWCGGLLAVCNERFLWQLR